MKKVLLVAVLAVLAFSACEKEEEAAVLSNLEILQSHKWIAVAGTRTQGSQVEDMYAEPHCEDDDVYEFNNDMKYFVDFGDKRCYDSQEGSFSYNYTLSANGDTLSMQDTPGYVPIFLKSINKDKMIWEVVYTYDDQDDLVINIEYVEYK